MKFHTNQHLELYEGKRLSIHKLKAAYVPYFWWNCEQIPPGPTKASQ